MTQRWTIRIFGIAIFLIVAIAGFGQAVFQLWNMLMPDIFGLPRISFWQAVGLLALSWILFGGWRGWGSGSRFGRRERWEMTPEQRQKVREGLREGCSGKLQPRPAEPGV